MEKNIDKKKNKGFTLIEILATILVLSIVSGVVVVNVVNYINTSKNNGKKLTYESIIKTGSDYINENLKDISWVNDGDSEFTCVSIISLVNAGYFKKDILKNDSINENSYIKITRDISNKTIIKEEMDKEGETTINDQCSPYYIKVPKCSNPIYNGFEQELIVSPEVADEYNIYKQDESGEFVEGYTAINHKKAPGYTLKFVINNSEKNWSDGKIGNERELNCNINKKKITIKLKKLEINEDEFEGNKYIGEKEDIIKNLNENITGLALDNHIITDLDITKNDEGNKVIPSKLIIKDNNGNDVTSNYDFDYKESKLTIVHNIIDIPTDSICNDLTYNGENQILASSKDEYTLSSNMGKDVGNYNVFATPNEGFKWTDKTTSNKTIICKIKKSDVSSITLTNKTVSYTGNNQNFANNDVTIKGIKNEVVLDENATYTFTYYTNASCTTTTTNHKDLGTYYGKVTVKNLSNYNNGTSNCAKLQITDKSILTFNASGGTVSPTSKEVYTNSKYGTLPTPVKTGYTFAGWYTAASGGTKVTADTIVTNINNHTLYAHWTANKYTVTYNSNGGANCSPTTITVTYGNTFGTLCSPTRTGYTFAGWYTAASGGSKIEKTTKVSITKNTQIYAHWTSKTVKVTFNKNDGSGTTKVVTYTYGKTGQKFNITWTRTGYNAKGWASSKGATSATWKWNASVSDNWINTNSPSITIYAVWKDETAPSCKVTKSNTGKISGVTVKFTCSDNGSGCQTGSKTYTERKSDISYTCKDKAGNSKKATADITSQKQTRYRTRSSSCKSCSSAGCSKWGGQKRYGSVGINGPTICFKTLASCKNKVNSLKSSKTNYGCEKLSSSTACGAHNTYAIWKQDCKTYKSSCSACGTSYGSWGSWSSWSTNSCSETSTKDCESRTVYK